jgi:hypothetical protein
MPESYTVIRGQQYVTEVIAVGEDVKLVEKETCRSVNVFWTSRNNKTGHAKIISEGDILNYKKAAEMKRHYHLTRRHFSRNKLHLGGDDRKKTKKVMVVLCR